MLLLRRPSDEVLRRFLGGQAGRPFSYAPVGATATTPPAGYRVDHTRVRLGAGDRLFAAAKDALRRWQHFRLGWVGVWPPEPAIRIGEVVAVVAHAGLWWLNACRVVYVIEEAGPVHRYGFAYGTLPDHAAAGEERFAVEWDRAGDAVWYDILAFSRPHHVLARLGHPWARRLQKRFARDSAAAMTRAVTPAGP
jgi:uncharacterized protein (UPF0548 family)